MRNLLYIDEILVELNQLRKITTKNVQVVSIGGCSRSGKSMLALELMKRYSNLGFACRILNIDSWLISFDKRKPFSMVTERYDMKAVNLAVEQIVNGLIVFPPVYDPISRRQILAIGNDPFSLKSGILIVDGVLALVDEDLLRKSDYKIFVKISECKRLRRLIDFYNRVKKISRNEYKKIIRDRELEEVPLIKKSSVLADAIFEW